MSAALITSRRSSWLVTVPLVAGIVAYLVWGFLPGMKALRDQRAEIQRQRNYIAQADLLTPVIAATEQDLAETLTFCGERRAKMANGKMRNDVQAQILHLAERHGVLKAHVTPLPPIPLETLTQQPIAVSVAGNFEKLAKFMASIEALSQAIWVSDVRIEGSQKDGKESVAELRLDVFVGRSEISD